MFVDQLDIEYKRIEDFGLTFKPFIEVNVAGSSPTQFNPPDEEKLNMSEMSSRLDISVNKSILRETTGRTNTGVGKSYHFKAVKSFYIII